MTDSSQKPSYARSLLLPAMAVPVGVGVGSLLGGGTAHLLATKVPRIRSALSRMSDPEKLKALKRLRGVTTAMGGTLGAAGSAIAAGYVQNELDKLKERREKANEKTASVYSIYIRCFGEML